MMRYKKARCLLTLNAFCFISVMLTHYFLVNRKEIKERMIYNTNTNVLNRTPTTEPQYAFTENLLKPGIGFNTTELLLYSAVAQNQTDRSQWDEVSVFGWESKHLSVQDHMCCLLYPSGRVEEMPAQRKKYVYIFDCDMVGRRFVCAIKDGNQKETATAVSLRASNDSVACNTSFTSYVNIGYAYKHPEEIAIFAKIVFLDLSARDLITWFEVHRLFGFSKVLVYPYQLHRNATKVLQYYERLGLLEILPFSVPGPEHGLKNTPLGSKSYQGWTDKDVSIMDGVDRLRGYKYIVSFDVDEYIIPMKTESWMDLFDSLFRDKKDAAAFYFYTYIYIKNWGPTNEDSSFTIGRYLNRTKLTSDRRKHVTIPSRIKEDAVTTHFVVPREKYRAYTVRKEDAALHHFRSCRQEWLKENATFPCYDVARYHDETVYSYLTKVQDGVSNLVLKLDV